MAAACDVENAHRMNDEARSTPSYLSLPASTGRVAPDVQYDGAHADVVRPSAAGKPEFPASTEVIYVNGINTTFATEHAQAQQYAEMIHGDVRLIHAATAGLDHDLETCAYEKFGFANNPPERAVVDTVLAHVHAKAVEGDVHFAAHSRGALIVQRGLEMVEQRLNAEHYSQGQIRDVLSHVSVETFGGASVGMPPGVRCVNYVSPEDSVANVFGLGKPSARDEIELAAAGASIGSVGVALEAKIYADHEGARPNGPVVTIPMASEAKPEGQIAELLANHAVEHYFGSRQPFELTYDRWHDVRVQDAVSKAGAQTRVTPVASVEPWDGKSATGSFVALADGDVAMHAGRGKYFTFDVTNDLHGAEPPTGRPVTVTRDGDVREDDARSASLTR